MEKLIRMLPEWMLYPIDWYLASTDWVGRHKHAATWLFVLLLLIALVL